VSNGGTSSRNWDGIRFDVICQQIAKRDQIGDAHRDASTNDCPIVYRVTLKHGIGVWPYVG